VRHTRRRVAGGRAALVHRWLD